MVSSPVLGRGCPKDRRGSSKISPKRPSPLSPLPNTGEGNHIVNLSRERLQKMCELKLMPDERDLLDAADKPRHVVNADTRHPEQSEGSGWRGDPSLCSG